MRFTEWHDSVETFAPDRKHESFRERIQVRTTRRQAQDLHPTPLHRLAKLSRVQRVSVEYQISLTHQEPVDDVQEVPRHLFHPNPVRAPRDAADLDPPGRQMDHEENVIADQTGPTQHLNGEEVARGDGRHVRLDELRPRILPFPQRHRLDALLFQDALYRYFGRPRSPRSSARHAAAYSPTFRSPLISRCCRRATHVPIQAARNCIGSGNSLIVGANYASVWTSSSILDHVQVHDSSTSFLARFSAHDGLKMPDGKGDRTETRVLTDLWIDDIAFDAQRMGCIE